MLDKCLHFRGGIIYSNLRASLKLATVLIHFAFQYFVREEQGIIDYRSRNKVVCNVTSEFSDYQQSNSDSSDSGDDEDNTKLFC